MLNNMKLGHKLSIGFGLVLCFTGLVAFVGIYGMNNIQYRVNKAEELDNMVKILLKTREHEKTFIIRRDSVHIETVHTQLNTLYERLNLTKKQFRQNINKDQMDQVITEIKNYENAFDTYAYLAEKKQNATEKMREKSSDALAQSEAICEYQRIQLEKSRIYNTELIRDKIAKTNDANQLFSYIMDAKVYRVLMMQGENKYLDEWKAVTQKIYALTKDMRSRFKQEKNILQADKVLDMYQKYESSMLKYLETRTEGDRITMIKTADDVVEAMKVIGWDQKIQLAELQTDFENELKDRLAKANDANQISRSFLASRKNEKEFIISGDITFVEAAKTYYVKSLQLAKELTSRFSMEENVRQGNMLIDALEKYATEFDMFVSLTKQQWEAEKKMAENAYKAQKVCDEAYADQKDKMHIQLVSAEWIIMGGAFFAILISLIASFFITRNITDTLRKVTKFADKLSRGDLSGRLPMGKAVNCSEILDCGVKDCGCFGREAHCWSEAGTFSMMPTCTRFIEGKSCRTCKAYKKSAPNELQEMGLALNAMTDALNVKADFAISVARGDLSRKIRLASKNDTFGKSLQEMIRGLNILIRQVNEAVSQIDDGAAQVSDSSQSVSQGAGEQASSLEQVTSCMIQIGSQTRANAENAYQANQLAVETREFAEEGMKEMVNMLLAMKEIHEASQSIARIIKIIDEIAFQINLLSLNAAVEAARAGHHGKGFAVVAEEVRNLASRSAKSAKETSELIENAFKKVEKGNHIANRTEQALTRIVEFANKVADLIGEIAASSNEQAQAVAQVNQGIGQIDQVTQQNAANAEETASTAEELSAQASQLRQILEQFKLNADGQDDPVNLPDYMKYKKNLPRAFREKYPSEPTSSESVESVDNPRQNEDGKMVKPEEIICFNDNDFEGF